MKQLAVLLLLVLPVAEAAVSSTLTVTPTTATAGEAVTVTYTRTASLTDGLQNGTVTLRINGPANLTLAAQAYHFTATLTSYQSAALSWTWTPAHAGTYTLTFTDHPTQGPASNQTQTYHVEDAAGGGGWIEPAASPLRVTEAWGLLALGLLLVVFPKPRAARNRTLRLIGVGLVVLAAVLLCVWWWSP